MKKANMRGNKWGKLNVVLRRLEFLGLYSYLKVQPSLGRRSSTFSSIRILRTSAYTSIIILLFLFIATIVPIYNKPILVEAATGTATASTLTFNSTNSEAGVSLTVSSATGTFATSSAEQKAAFSISTNNVTGYTVSITAASGSATTLAKTGDSGTTFATLPSTAADGINEATFNTTTYNNMWGYMPSTYRSKSSNTANSTLYFPAPTYSSPKTLAVTQTANEENSADNYTIGLGLRADYTNPSGTYTNSTFIIQYVANAVEYTITYSADGISGVDNLPSTQSASASHTETPSTSGSTTTVTTGTASVNLSTVVPTRTGYTFSGWCLGTLSNNGTTCTGTTYASGASFGIDKTADNANVTLKATWEAVLLTITVSYDGNNADAGNMSGLTYDYNYYATDFYAVSDLAASNYSRSGYGFAGWSLSQIDPDASDATAQIASAAIYGPNSGVPISDINLGDESITVYAVWVKSAGIMQDWNGCSTLPSNNITALTDERDGETYTVAKFTDGVCSMAENLRLNLAEVEFTEDNTNNPTENFMAAGSHRPASASSWSTATSIAYYPDSFTNRSSDPQIPQYYFVDWITGLYSHGGYYNWYTATAGNGDGSSMEAGEDAAGDICPTGWRLPKHSDFASSIPRDFPYNGIWSKGYTCDSYCRVEENWDSSIWTPTLSYSYSSFFGRGTYAYTINNSGNGSGMEADANFGYPIRCIADV